MSPRPLDGYFKAFGLEFRAQRLGHKDFQRISRLFEPLRASFSGVKWFWGARGLGFIGNIGIWGQGAARACSSSPVGSSVPPAPCHLEGGSQSDGPGLWMLSKCETGPTQGPQKLSPYIPTSKNIGPLSFWLLTIWSLKQLKYLSLLSTEFPTSRPSEPEKD